MTPAARLHAALDLMEAVDRDPRPSDAVVSGWLRARRGLGEGDRGAVLDLLAEVMRHRARLGWWVGRLGGDDTPRGRLLVWLALGDRLSPDRIARLFTGGRDAAPVLSEAERHLVTALNGGSLSDPAMPEAVRLEIPDWAEAPLRARFGDTLTAEMSALLVPPALDLRVNTRKATRDRVLRDLRDAGVQAVPTPMAPQGIRLPARLSLTRLAPLKTGEVEIQDEGSQLVALLVDAQPGERVADFCAGAGGKTLAIATQMDNRGHVAACDVSEGRLKRCAERLRKAGLHNVQTQVLTGETDRWIKRRKGTFDRVLVDAPCSGTGTWRRNPDARWRAQGEGGLGALVALQGRILASAARLVKPGGRLVYATCSLLTEENAHQVDAFLAAHPAFRLVPVAQAQPMLAAQDRGGYLSLTPAQDDTDGFFAAVMMREAAPEATD